MASRPTSSRAPTGSAANPVRRNLFQGHHLTRRVPTGASSLAAAGAAGGTTSAPSNHSTEETQHDNHDPDIIARDHNGEPDCYMPDLQMQVITEEERRAGRYGEDGSYGERESMFKPRSRWIAENTSGLMCRRTRRAIACNVQESEFRRSGQGRDSERRSSES